MKKSLLVVLIFALMLFAGCSGVTNQTNNVSKDGITRLAFSEMDMNLTNETKDVPVIKNSDIVDVIVELGDGIADAFAESNAKGTVGTFAATEEGKALVADMKAAQTEFLCQLEEAGICYEVNYTYTTLFNGFSINVAFGDLDKIADNCTTRDFYLSETYSLPTEAVRKANYADMFQQTGLFKNNTGYNGEGMVIAILDSAFDYYNHSAFKTMPERTAITEGDLWDIMEALGIYQDGYIQDTRDFYVNKKVPFAWDYAHNDPWADPERDDAKVNHGTHVAGIAVGNDNVLKAAASEAQLLAMKVFPDYSTGTSTSMILRALGDALVLGADVINMSLGAAAGFTVDRGVGNSGFSNVIATLNECGVIVCCASGNDYVASYESNSDFTEYTNDRLTSNPDDGIIGAPASYHGSMSVGSVDNTKNIYFWIDDTKIVINNAVDGNYLPHDFYDVLGEEQSEKFGIVFVPGYGLETDYEGIDVNGKIAFVQRGSNTFEEKLNIAAENGAVACIIYNNSVGELNAQIMTATIPVATMTLADAAILEDAGIAEITLDKANVDYTVSIFSSRGALEDLTIGVDILGVGGNVWSAADHVYSSTIGGAKYFANSGTSMATPNVSSVMAVVKQYLADRFPHLTNRELMAMAQQIVMSTATIVYDENGVAYSPRAQGAGLANLQAVVDTNAYLYVNGYDKTKLSLGHDENKAGVYTLNFRLANFGESVASYDLSTIAMTELANDEFMTGLDKYLGHNFVVSATNAVVEGNVITVEAGQTASIKVIITIDDEAKAYMDENYVNGIYVEGFAVLKSLEGGVDLSIPYMAFYGDWYQAPIFEPTIWDAYENGAAVQDNPISLLNGMLAPSGQSWDTDGLAAGPEFAKWENVSFTYIDGIMYLEMGMLRNASEFTFRIYDYHTGDVFFDYAYANVPRSYMYYGVQYSPTSLELRLQVMSMDTWLNNGTYVFELTAIMNENEDSRQIVEIPFRIDFDAPVLTDARKVVEGDRTYLEIDFWDNVNVCRMLPGTINEEGKLEAFGTYWICSPDYKFNSINTQRIDITEKIEEIEENGGAMGIVIWDYALNIVQYQINISGEGNPIGGEINSAENNGEGIVIDSTADEPITTMSYEAQKVQLLAQSAAGDFVIKDGVLQAYGGEGGDVVVPEGVTSVANYVFYQNAAITSVTLPEGVTSIGTYNFYLMKNLKTIVLPSTLETIGKYSFTSLMSLESVNLEDTKIANYSYNFVGITSQKEFIIPDAGKAITISNSFNYMISHETLTVKTAVAKVQNSFFYGGAMKAATFEKDVDVIDSPNGSSFRGSTTLETLNFKGNVGTIGYEERIDFSFQSFSMAGLYGLKEVNFYGNVGSIKGAIFSSSTELTKIAFGGSIDYLGANFASNCPMITSFEVMDGNTQLVKDEETGVVYDADKTKMFIPCAWNFEGEFVVPETVTSLMDGQFSAGYYQSSMNNIPSFTWRANGSYYFSIFFVVEENKEFNETLTGVVLNDNITKVPTGAFGGCMALEKVNLENVTAYGEFCFKNSGIKSVVMNENTTEVGAQMFYKATKLEELYIPEGAKLVYKQCNAATSRQYFFAELHSLKEITVPASLNLPNLLNPFYNDYKLEKVTYNGTMTTIPANAFWQCFELKELVGFDGVKSIGSNAFVYCTSLKEINLPNVTSVGASAFAYCHSLERYTFSENLSSMGKYAFADCRSLKEIYIAAKLRVNFTDVFIGMEALETITVHPNNPNYASVDGALYNKAMTQIILYPNANPISEYTVPVTVTAIGDKVFYGAKALESIIMKGVKTIGLESFVGSSVSKVDAPMVVTIGDKAFENTFVSEMDMSNVQSIGNYAFSNTNLTEVKLSSLRSIGSFAFRNNVNLKKVILGNVDYFFFGMVFHNCLAIEEIEVTEDCKSFVIENETLMNAKKDQIIRYLGHEETIVIPEGVVKVWSNAYINNDNIKEVQFPSTMAIIGDAAFYGCDNLEVLVFKSAKAPALESMYGRQGYGKYNLMYCNFGDYLEEMGDRVITIYTPADESYNTYIWQRYFAERYNLEDRK